MAHIAKPLHIIEVNMPDKVTLEVTAKHYVWRAHVGDKVVAEYEMVRDKTGAHGVKKGDIFEQWAHLNFDEELIDAIDSDSPFGIMRELGVWEENEL